ncbi:MAG: hypothetical protein AB8D78_13990 [Akkermansiaceae bacterium]
MNVRNFIGASSCILLAWLGATYFHEVPYERYPAKKKFESSAAVISEAPDREIVIVEN